MVKDEVSLDEQIRMRKQYYATNPVENHDGITEFITNARTDLLVLLDDVEYPATALTSRRSLITFSKKELSRMRKQYAEVPSEGNSAEIDGYAVNLRRDILMLLTEVTCRNYVMAQACDLDKRLLKAGYDILKSPARHTCAVD